MMTDLATLDAALAADRLFVRVDRSWFLAIEVGRWTFDNGDWIVKVRAGPHRARGIITNIDGNRDGRTFAILPEPGA